MTQIERLHVVQDTLDHKKIQRYQTKKETRSKDSPNAYFNSAATSLKKSTRKKSDVVFGSFELPLSDAQHDLIEGSDLNQSIESTLHSKDSDKAGDSPVNLQITANNFFINENLPKEPREEKETMRSRRHTQGFKTTTQSPKKTFLSYGSQRKRLDELYGERSKGHPITTKISHLVFEMEQQKQD